MSPISSDGAASPARSPRGSAAASSAVGGGGNGQLSARAHSQRRRLSPSLYPAPSPRLAPSGGEGAVSPFVSCQHQQQVPSWPAPALDAGTGSSSSPLLHGPAMSPSHVVRFAQVAAAAAAASEQNAPLSGASAGLPLPSLWPPSRGDGNFAELAPTSAYPELASLPPGLCIPPTIFADLKEPAPAAPLPSLFGLGSQKQLEPAHPSPTMAPDLPPHPGLGFAQFPSSGREAASSSRSPRSGSCLPPLWRASRNDGDNLLELAQSSSSTAGDLFTGFRQPAADYDLPPLPPSLRITEAPAATPLAWQGQAEPSSSAWSGLPPQPRDNGFLRFEQSPSAASEQQVPPPPQRSETFPVRPSSSDLPPWSDNNMGGFVQMSSNSELVLQPTNQQPIGIDAGVRPSRERESISLDEDDGDFDMHAVLRSFQGPEDQHMLDLDVDASSSGPHLGGGGRGPNTPWMQAGSSSVQSWGAGPAVCQWPAEASNMATYAIGGSSSGGGRGMPRNWGSSSMIFNNSKLTIGGMKSRGGRPPQSTFTFPDDEMAAIMKDERLKELLKTDPRRVKASLSTRQYSKKANMEKEKQKIDLEDKIITLQMECCTLRAQLQSLQEGCTELIDEKRRLGIMVQEMEKLMQLKDALFEALSNQLHNLSPMEPSTQ